MGAVDRSRDYVDVMYVSYASVAIITQPMTELLEGRKQMDYLALHDTTTEQITRVRNLVRRLYTHLENLTSDPSEIRQVNHV